MLNDLKKLYANIAEAILGSDWKKLDKSDCIRGYCDTLDKDKSEGYLAAAFVKYWHLIDSYTTKSNGGCDPETVYDWLTHCFQYAKKHQPWKRGGNLEGQENGPDKALNIYMKSMRQGYYQWSNSKKRSADFNQRLSLDKMVEDTGDANLIDCVETDYESLPSNLAIKQLVVKQFNNKNYMSSFIIDGIINAQVFDLDKTSDGKIYSEFNKRKLSKHLRTIDDKYCNTFAASYEIPVEKVIEARNECSSLSSNRIYTYMRNTLNSLKKDPLFSDR